MDDKTKRGLATFYKDNIQAVHITKSGGHWHNGIIVEVKGDFLILEDERVGDIPIFFSEINLIDKREARR